jgi:hypothetical protein
MCPVCLTTTAIEEALGQQLGFTMEWVRHHDRYGSDEFADADKPYWPATEIR